MSEFRANRSFTQGMAAMADSRHEEAAGHFRTALQVERESCVGEPDERFVSYYGLSLALASGRAVPAAIDACRMAVRRNPARPVLLLNLGRVYQLAGLRSRALDCFQRGLDLAPDNSLIQRHLRLLDRRRSPVFAALSRSNPLNRWVGRLRTRQPASFLSST